MSLVSPQSLLRALRAAGSRPAKPKMVLLAFGEARTSPGTEAPWPAGMFSAGAADLRYCLPGVRVSKIRKISKILQIFGGLVLGCIKTNFCKKICVCFDLDETGPSKCLS